MDSFQLQTKLLALQMQSLQRRPTVDWTDLRTDHSQCQCIFCTDKGFDLDRVDNDISFSLDNDMIAELSH